MNFQAMRSDGYSDTDIVESLRQSELFKDTADFDGLRKKGFDDTKIIDFLDATPSFHEAVNTRRSKQTSETPPAPTPPQNNEGDVEALGDTSVPSSVPPAQEVPVQDDSFLGLIKNGGKKILEGLGFVADIVTGDMGDAMMSAGQKVLKEKAKDMPEEKRASWNQGIDDLGTLNRNLNDPIDGLMSENTHYTSPAGTTKEQAVQIAKLYNPAEKSMTQGIKDWLFSEDNPNGITEEQVQERIQNVAQILNKPIDDIMIDTNPKSETYGVPYVKGANGEFLSTKSESVWENISTEMEADFPTILAQIGADKAGWDAGGVVGDKLSKFIPNKFLAAATRLGGRVVGSATSSTLATPAGTVVQKAQNAFETGVHEDADAYVSEAWRDMKDNFVATVAGSVALEGIVAGAKGAKVAYTATKDYLTGDTRSYNMMLKDFGVDEQYAKDAIGELNEMLKTPIEDSKQARMYAMAMKHAKGLDVLRASLFRNPEAYQRVESEILDRTTQLKELLKNKTLDEGELDSFLKEASDDASRQYKAMRDILRVELANTPVTFNSKQVAKTIEELLVPKVIDEDAKKAIKNIVKLIKTAPYLTSNVDGLIELRHLINRRMNRSNVSEHFTTSDWGIIKGMLESIDQTIHKTIDSAVSPEDAKALKEIFESAKADYSKQKKAEASTFFESITKDLDSTTDKVKAVIRGYKSDSDAAKFVLSRLTSEQRERLELTAIHETILKNITGADGGVEAVRHKNVLADLETMGKHMTSETAKEALAMIKKVNTLFAKDSSLLVHVTEKEQNSLAMSLSGKLEFGLWQRMFEFVQRHTPTNKAARLQIYNRLGKYMETSHSIKQLALKMYNDPLSSAKDKLFWGKYIRYYNDGDNEGMAQLMQNPPEPPKGGGSGLMDETEIDNLSQSGKTPTAEELKAKLDDEAKAFKPDDTNPPDDNGGGGGSPKPKEGADNGVQGQKEALGRQSVEEIEASTGKTLDQLGDEDGFYTHYSQHEFDTLSSRGAKDAGNLGQTKGKETNEKHTINVTFGYKKGARVENEYGIGLAGQHEYKIDLRGREFFDNDKKNYFFKKVQELKDEFPQLSEKELYIKAKEALGYDDATVDKIVAFQDRYDAMRKANPNQTTKDTQNSVLKEMKLDGIKNKNHLEILEDAPVYKVRTLEHDIDYAGMARPRSMDGLPPVSGEGISYANRLYGTIETTPSKSNPSNIDPFNEVLDTLSPQQRIDFEKKHLPLVQQLAEDLGLSVEAEVSHGAFAGQTNPNIIVHFKEFYAKSRFADKQFKFKDEYGNLSVQAKEQIEAFLVAFGKATNQDGVGWYAPIYRGDQTGKHGYVEITEPLTLDQWKTLYANLQGEWGEIVPVMHKGRIDFMNWPELEGKQFETIVMDAIDSLESGVISKKIVKFNNDGTLIERTEYERWMGSSGSESGRQNLPTGDSRIWSDATQRFEQGVQDLRRGLQERPKLDGGQKTVQDPIGGDGGKHGATQPDISTHQKTGEQLERNPKVLLEEVYHPDNEAMGKTIFISNTAPTKTFVAGEKIEDTIIDGLEFFWNKTDKSINEISTGLRFTVDATTKNEAIKEAKKMLLAKKDLASGIKNTVAKKQGELDNLRFEANFKDGSSYVDGFEVPIDVALAGTAKHSSTKEAQLQLFDASENLYKLISTTNNPQYTKDLKQFRELRKAVEEDPRYAKNSELNTARLKLINATERNNKTYFTNGKEEKQASMDALQEAKDAYRSVEKSVLDGMGGKDVEAYQAMKAKLENIASYADASLIDKMHKAQAKVKKLEEQVIKAGQQTASDLKDAPASTFKGGYVRPEVLSFMTKTLTGATGGSLSEYDYNGDGKIDFKDRAIGAALGVVGFHALTSQPAFSAYKALAEHGIKQLEQRAEQGDIIAQMALGTRYIYASEKGVGDVAPFVSKAGEIIEAMPKKMDTESFFKFLRNNGVKEDEINFSGLQDLVEKKSVTKEEVKAAFDSPKLERKVLGGKQLLPLSEAKRAEMKKDIDELWTTINNDVYQRMKDEDIIGKLKERFAAHGKELDEHDIEHFSGMTYDNFLEQHPKYDEYLDKSTQYHASQYRGREFGEPKFEKYSSNIPDSDNYREVLATLDGKGTFKSAHWEEPNVLYHIRLQDARRYEGGRVARDAMWKKVDEARQALEEKYGAIDMKWDRTDPLYKAYRDAVDAAPTLKDREKMLVVEEIQSDWHQAGRKEGYRTKEISEAQIKSKLDELWKEARKYTDEGKDAPEDLRNNIIDLNDMLTNRSEGKGKVPQAPYAKTWHEKAMKDVIKEAIENDYDRVAWVMGKEQADRYSLAKQLDALEAVKDSNGWYEVYAGKGTRQVFHKMHVKPEELPDLVGKEMAEKIIKDGGGVYEGLDLEVGGEGMKGFYDKILPAFTSKYIKKYGATLETITLDNGQKVWSFKVTPQMKKEIGERGQYLFSLLGAGGAGVAVMNSKEKTKEGTL